MSDATFQDGSDFGPDAPLRLMALDADDLPPISALVQDAVFTSADLAYLPKRRRFALLLNRFRWEDHAAAATSGRPYERVKSLLVIESITALRSKGFDPKTSGDVQALLALTYAARDDIGGVLTLVLASGGAIALDIEAVDITLRDVTRPHLAQSKSLPNHGV